MKLSEELIWRGFVKQSTFDDLSELDKKGKITFYHGFDASADSQAIGNLAAMMFDKTLMRHGHKAVLLAGGATSLIGDPGGKDKERVLQDEKTIARNVAKAEQQISKIFAGHKFTLVNNLDWLKNVKMLDFLRDIGKHFSMTPLVQRDYIAQRIGEGGSGITYTEFSYTLLQGYDYLYLYDKYGCTLQLGGSDQWGNCLSGVELVRKARGAEVDVITLPLVMNKATGKKFGKSEEGAVWLDENKTSVFAFYQFWLNSDDAGVEGYLKVFTELDKPEIDKIMKEFNQNPGQRAAQKRLAWEITKLVHGEGRANEAKKASEVLFGQGSFLNLSRKEVLMLKKELPSAKRQKDFLETILQTGLTSSKSETRKLLESGAISINGNKITSLEEIKLSKGANLIKKGKNSFAIIDG